MRLDLYLVEEGAFESRAQAQTAIKEGLVSVAGEIATKTSQKVSAGAEVCVSGALHPYVSRGGLKLAAALEAFGVTPAGKVCLDLGASTGGFCDVLLRAGAAKIYAIDVGHGQLHEKIAHDRRVINMEKTHAKDLTSALVPDPIDLVVCDVSFISLTKTLPKALALTGPAAHLIALIKPQFEVGKAGLGKGGLVRADFIQPAVDRIYRWVEKELQWHVIGLIDSPITGGDGNKEFLIGAQKQT